MLKIIMGPKGPDKIILINKHISDIRSLSKQLGTIDPTQEHNTILEPILVVIGLRHGLINEWEDIEYRLSKIGIHLRNVNTVTINIDNSDYIAGIELTKELLQEERPEKTIIILAGSGFIGGFKAYFKIEDLDKVIRTGHGVIYSKKDKEPSYL